LAEVIGKTPGSSQDFSTGAAERTGCVLGKDEDPGLS